MSSSSQPQYRSTARWSNRPGDSCPTKPLLHNRPGTATNTLTLLDPVLAITPQCPCDHHANRLCRCHQSRTVLRRMDKILHDLVYLHYGIYGTIICLGHAEFLSINSICRTSQPYWKQRGECLQVGPASARRGSTLLYGRTSPRATLQPSLLTAYLSPPSRQVEIEGAQAMGQVAASTCSLPG